MDKFRKQERAGATKKLLAVTAILAVVAVLTVAMLWEPAGTPGTGPNQGLPQDGTEQTPATGPASDRDPTAEQPLPVLEYPMILEDGRLEIENLFQYDGMNPDCGDEEGKNVASIMLHNASNSHLLEADIHLTLEDGSVLTFHVAELPAQTSAMVFEKGNVSTEEKVTDAVCTAVWDSAAEPMPEALPVTVDGVAVTVTNKTGRDISELVIYCRCPLGEEYFGGIAYSYTINNLPANESATVEAWDCILGMVEVVRIAEN